MKFDEIADSIFQGRNLYEEQRGIKTIKVIPWKKISHQIHLFLGFKQQKEGISLTLFLALRKGPRSNNWEWICPDEDTCLAMGHNIPKYYNFVITNNQKIEKFGAGVKDINILSSEVEKV